MGRMKLKVKVEDVPFLACFLFAAADGKDDYAQKRPAKGCPCGEKQIFGEDRRADGGVSQGHLKERSCGTARHEKISYDLGFVIKGVNLVTVCKS